MRVPKALLGGSLGGLVGIAIVVGLQVLLQYEAGWLDLWVGFCTGLGVRWLTAQAAQPSYLCGTLAAALALAAIIAGKHTAAAVLTYQGSRAVLPATQVEAATANDGATVAGADLASEDEVVSLPRQVGGAERSAVSRQAAGDASQIVWLALAAAMAYLIGRGSDSPLAADAPPDAEPPLEEDEHAGD